MMSLANINDAKFEAGDSVKSNSLIYASLKRYMTSEDSKIKLSRIKLYYEREEQLVAIQFTLFDYLSNTEVQTEPKTFGPVNTYCTKKTIDEIVLNLQQDENIYLVKGTLKDDRLIKFAIFTTFGQFVEFGSPKVEVNFSWEYYYNLQYFDGFILGWTENCINYIASLIVENTENIDEKKVALNDITYDSRLYNIDPIFLSVRYGNYNSYTTVEDELFKLNIYDQIKAGAYYISQIVCYYDKFINCIEVEYTKVSDEKEKLKANHIGIDTRKNKDKKAVLQIGKDDFISSFKVTFNTIITSLTLKTHQGKSINCVSRQFDSYTDGKAEIYEVANDKITNVIGFIIGHHDNIHCIQCYYEKKSVS